MIAIFLRFLEGFDTIPDRITGKNSHSGAILSKPYLLNGIIIVGSPESAQPKEQREIDVWDVPTRFFHWGVALAVATSLISEELGNMDIHVISGHVVLTLVMFRIMWGFVGGRHARFSDFIKGPGTVIDYARSMFDKSHKTTVGHNPLGALSVIALLLVLLVQAGTGLFSNDDILIEGPLFDLVSKSTSDLLTYYHGLSSNVLYGLIGLHLAAVAFYTFNGHKIMGAMVFGKKENISAPQKTDTPVKGNIFLAIILLAISAAIAWFIYNF